MPEYGMPLTLNVPCYPCIPWCQLEVNSLCSFSTWPSTSFIILLPVFRLPSLLCHCKREGFSDLCPPLSSAPGSCLLPFSHLSLCFAALYVLSDIAGYWGRLDVYCAGQIYKDQLFLVPWMMRVGVWKGMSCKFSSGFLLGTSSPY